MSSRIIRSASDELKSVANFNFASVTASKGHPIPPEVQSIPAQQKPLPVPPAAVEPPHENHQGKMQAAQTEAEQIVRQAKAKAAEIEKDAYEKGFSEGEKAGREVGEKMVEALLKQYGRSLEELNTLRKEVFASAEREVIRLALEVAKKVVKREVNIDDELILTLIKVALSRLSEQAVMTIRLNPKDLQSVQHHHSDPAKALNEGIRLVEDPMITRGGCLIETESGIIDARVEEQFKEIERGFFE
ncbi:MAG: FliH/SctL family protein [Acidobacteriota bacterium]